MGFLDGRKERSQAGGATVRLPGQEFNDNEKIPGVIPDQLSLAITLRLAGGTSGRHG